jgi:hypothetical protein
MRIGASAVNPVSAIFPVNSLRVVAEEQLVCRSFGA